VSTFVWPNGDPRDVAHAIVGEPRFRGVTAPAASGPTLVERVLAWAGDRLHDLFGGIGRALGSSNALGGLLVLVLLLAIAVAVVWLIVRFVRLPGRRHRARKFATAALEPERTSAQLLAQARRAAAEERWHEAASALVRAALLALDETGRLRFDPARTAGEARRLLHDADFDAFEREATPALFADGAATPERFARLREAYARTFGTAA